MTFTTEVRYDTLRLDARVRKDSRGMIVTPNTRLTRVGVFEYTRADGSKSFELREPSEVFAAAHLESLHNAPVTVGHPALSVTASARAAEVGHVGIDVRRDGDFIAATLSIRDAATIEKVEGGQLSEISLGYAVRMDHTPGVYNGQRYDARQTNLIVNHAALLPPGSGRAGRDCAIRLDSSSAAVRVASTFYGDLSSAGATRMDQRDPHANRDPFQARIEAAQQRLDQGGGAPEDEERGSAPQRRDAAASRDPIQTRLDAAQRLLDQGGGSR